MRAIWCVAVWLGMAGAVKAQVGTPDGAEVVHIEVRVEHRPSWDAPLPKIKNFRLEAAGTPVPLKLVRLTGATPGGGAVMTHLLVMLQPVDRAALDQSQPLGQKLGKAFAQGWLVSVALGPKATPYVGSAVELNAALAAGKGGDGPAAFRALQGFAGRRVLLLGEPKLERTALTIAQGELPDVYAVDGGAPVDHYFYDDGPARAGKYGRAAGGYSSAGTVVTESLENRRREFVWHVKSLEDAMRQALKDAGRTFELQAGMPAGAVGPLRLQLVGLVDNMTLDVDSYVAGKDGVRRKLGVPLVVGR